ncbi:2-oxo-4-hydroxy-4-carboxy-5-ureidoimidazoline decarboxylase [Azospirillum baldaniorum]|nr:2-oxo-4-hydroxy-4-carboxy-5-ureidoimidazoline decarboxylase [Azospirillum baldaniorum]
MDRASFVARFGGVFEHSPWVAEGAWDAGNVPDDVDGLHAAMVAVLRAADHGRKLTLLNAHPDLAGRLALRGELTADSTAEQASAGLDRCTPEEFARFTELNDAYKARFGFPFILAVKGRSRADILEAFETRLSNGPEEEFATALAQVERITWLRLKDLLPKDIGP